LGVVVLGAPNVPLDDAPLDVPAPVDAPDPLVPDDAPDEPEPLDPPDEPPPDPPPPCASADAGNATAARRRANVLSFMAVLPDMLLGFLKGNPARAAVFPGTGIRGGRNLRFIRLFTRCETDRKAIGG